MQRKTHGVGWILGGMLMTAGTAIAESDVWQGRAAIEFHATSTLHDFSGTAQADPFFFLVALDGPSATLGGTAIVAVAQMDTRHAKRDANMRKMFDAELFSIITGVVEPIRIDPTTRPQVPLLLTIRDRTQTVPAKLAGWRMDNGILRFELAMSLSLQKSGLTPPVLFGFIKVGDAVAVRIHVDLEKPPDATAAP
jgi:hypothetical protein